MFYLNCACGPVVICTCYPRRWALVPVGQQKNLKKVVSNTKRALTRHKKGCKLALKNIAREQFA